MSYAERKKQISETSKNSSERFEGEEGPAWRSDIDNRNNGFEKARQRIALKR
jgi:hypothetical protein